MEETTLGNVDDESRNSKNVFQCNGDQVSPRNGNIYVEHNNKCSGSPSKESLTFRQPMSRKTCLLLGFAGLLLLLLGFGAGVLIGLYAIHKDPETAVNGCNAAAQKGDDSASSSDETRTSRSAWSTLSPTQPSVTNDKQCVHCEIHDPFIEAADIRTTSLFAPLTLEEMDSVYWVLKSRNLVSALSGLNKNYMKTMYLHPPKKAEALEYLDKSGPFPGRYAKVHVTRAAVNSPDVMEYLVGPTNETKDAMTVTKLRADGEIPFNRRPYDSYELSTLRGLVRTELEKVKDLLKESFDGAYYGNGISVAFSIGHTKNDSDRTFNGLLHLTGGYVVPYTMKPLPLYCTCHSPGKDKTKWYCSDFFYLNQGPYSSCQDLLDAYKYDPNFRTVKLVPGFRQNKQKEFELIRNDTIPDRDGELKPPPRLYEPKGPRYTVQGQTVKWMGWQFEFTSNTIRGPAVFDVRFQGQRIAYEISLNDVTLAYSSGSAGAGVSPPLLSDTVFYLGHLNYVTLGVDCPEHATILTTTRWKQIQDAGCLFEAGGQDALWRHSVGKGLLNHYLVVRVPIVLGNYDYTINFRFYLDGRIEIDVSSSGYLFTSFWDSNSTWVDENKSSTQFGFKISDYITGSIHDHSFLFKVDLDVAGHKNSFELIKWKGGDPLSAIRNRVPSINNTESLEFFPFSSTRFVEYEIVDSERGFIYDPLQPAFWTIVNEKERNAWGVKRGYEIIPKYTALENLPIDHPVYRMWSHYKSHISVTKRKDSESFGSQSTYDLTHPWTPIDGGIDAFLNNESIRNEDLVLWVNAKFFHLPTSEDIPMTRRVDKGFVLKPFNYFDRFAVFDIPFFDRKPAYTFEPCYEN